MDGGNRADLVRLKDSARPVSHGVCNVAKWTVISRGKRGLERPPVVATGGPFFARAKSLATPSRAAYISAGCL
jgi:hypothetical protein